LDGLEEARAALGRLDECLAKLEELARGNQAAPESSLVTRFTEVMDEDLNVSAAWGVVFEWVRETNRRIAGQDLNPAQAAAGLAAWEQIDKVMGLGRPSAQGEAPREVTALLEEREAARKAKDFQKADALRKKLKELGWVIEDTPKGARLKKV
jgi:cysteinyl-tRNA synthetase